MTQHPHSAWTRRSVLGLLGTAPLAATGVLAAPGSAHAEPGGRPAGDPDLDAAIQRITHRPEFENSRWGMVFYTPDTDEHIYSTNPGELFEAGSAFKVFIAGTVFATLGPGHLFRTKVYRTGPVTGGVLHGDLVLVAGGDLLVGGRPRRDGTLLLPDPDHSYGTTPGAAAIPNPLAVLRRIAGQVAARGVKRVTGRVLVDASLFREATADISNSPIPVTLSPMMVNDNIVDVTVTPGNRAGANGFVHASPQTGYLRIINDVRTIAAADAPAARNLEFAGDTAHPDGTRTVTLTGDIPVDKPSLFRAYYVPEPVRFAELAFAEALRDCGVHVRSDAPGTRGASRHRLVEHVPLPLSDQVKGMLKVSSNVHTAAWPYLVGAIAGHDPENPVAHYERFRRTLMTEAGLDPDPPGAADGRYTADYFVRFLTHVKQQPYFPQYRSALPIMGRDGTIAKVEVDSLAAGHVFAKTGTALAPHGPNPAINKALAGYLQLPNGCWIVFAQFVSVPTMAPGLGFELAELAGAAMGEIATAVYTCSPR